MQESLKKDLRELIETAEASEALIPQIAAAAAAIVETLRAGSTVFSCGNGGSAADALHLAEELSGRYCADRPSLRGICLSADVTALTCIANDYGFEKIFSRQLEGLGRAGDILVGFSTSGNSANVVEAFEAAKKKGVRTILLSGCGGGKLRGAADFEIIVPSSRTARIQEIHTFILHSFLEAVEAQDWA